MSQSRIKANQRILKTLDKLDPNYYSISVKVLNDENLIALKISKKNTVEQVIEHILHSYKEKYKLPYKSSKGYDLRIYIDGDIIYDMKPLERHLRLEEVNIDAVAFCINKGYKQSSTMTAVRKPKEKNNGDTTVSVS